MATSALIPIIPCSNLDRSQKFYEDYLGFELKSPHRAGGALQVAEEQQYYRIMCMTETGFELHLRLLGDKETAAYARIGGLDKVNTGGIYIRAPGVISLAERCTSVIIEAASRAEAKPWGMTEYSISDPDGTLIRVGWPTDQCRAQE